MNRQIVKIFGLILVLYALLFGFTSYWSVFDSSSLKANTANRRPLLEEQKIKRGDILADDGTVIAHSRQVGKGNNKIYVRHYPLGSLFGNPIGYSFVDRGRVGFELSHNDELVGNKTEFLSVLDELQGHAQEGDNVQSALDPDAQRAAVDGLAGRRGSVVAMVPSTGEIKAMVSIPEYDPNSVESSNTFKRLNTETSAPLFNRATQAGYPPGSTMKVVTATAALDSGKFTPTPCSAAGLRIAIEGVPLSNSGGEQFGDIPMTTALTNSVNTWWAQAGEKIGKDTMFKYMDRYGFNAKPRLDYPGLPARGERGLRRQQAARPRRHDRHRARRDRPGAAPGDAAADGGGGGDRRQQGRADGAAALVQGDRPRRAGDEARSRPPEPGDERGHGREAQRHDAGRRLRGNRDGGGGLWHRRGGQDRDRGDLARRQRRLVHRLRPGGRPADRDRLHRRAHQRLRRADLRSDLQGGRREPARQGGA